jgi:MFS transporter, DHA1 family, multidrug resistance protein
MSIKSIKINKNIKNSNWLFLLIITLMSAAGLVGSDLYLPMMPEIVKNFKVQEHDIQLTLSLYLLGLAFGQLILGPITDKFGRRKPLLLGLSLYCLASLGCAYSFNYVQFLILRFIQALGASSGLVIGRAIIGDLYDAKESGKIFSTIFPFVGMSPAISPFIGGIIGHYFGWESTFIFIAIYSLLLNILVFNYLPETFNPLNQKISKFSEVISIYIKILSKKEFIIYAIAPCSAYIAYFAYIIESPFIFHLLKFEEWIIGTFYITLSITYVSGNLLGKRMLNDHELNYLIKLGFIFFSFGGLLLLITGIFNLKFYFMILSISVLTFGNGFLIPLGTAGVISYSNNNKGYISGLLGFIQLSLTSLSAFIIHLLTNGVILYLGIYIFIVAILSSLIFFLRGKKNVSNKIIERKT